MMVLIAITQALTLAMATRLGLELTQALMVLMALVMLSMMTLLALELVLLLLGKRRRGDLNQLLQRYA